MPVTHPFVSAISDGADATLVRPSNWNAEHSVTGYQLVREDAEFLVKNDIIVSDSTELMWSTPDDRMGLMERMPDPINVPNGYYWMHLENFIAGNDHVVDGDGELIVFDLVPHGSLILDGA